MPLHHRAQPNETPQSDALLLRLVNEWRNPQPDATEPIIIEESPSNQERTNHLYVVWSDWAALTPIERSRLVLQAYTQVRGADLASNVTLAMGLTPDDAKRLNLPV